MAARHRMTTSVASAIRDGAGLRVPAAWPLADVENPPCGRDTVGAWTADGVALSGECTSLDGELDGDAALAAAQPGSVPPDGAGSGERVAVSAVP
jgi:hypothetical protein